MDLLFSDFVKIVEQFPYLKRIHLQGIGEPLLCRDLLQMVHDCTGRGIAVGTTTNAMLIDESVARQLVASGIDSVTVSFDSSSPSTFERIRRGSCFDTIRRSVQTLMEHRREPGKPRLAFMFTGTTENIHDLPDVVTTAHEWGIDRVFAQEALVFGEDVLDQRMAGLKLSENPESTRTVLREAARRATEYGIPFEWFGLRNGGVIGTDIPPYLHEDVRLCRNAFRSCYITVDGYAVPCSCYPDPEKFNFGNILKENFSEIWNGEKYVAFRRAKLSGQAIPLCSECTVPKL